MKKLMDEQTLQALLSILKSKDSDLEDGKSLDDQSSDNQSLDDQSLEPEEGTVQEDNEELYDEEGDVVSVMSSNLEEDDLEEGLEDEEDEDDELTCLLKRIMK